MSSKNDTLPTIGRTWHDIRIGQPVGPLTYSVTREMVLDFCHALPADQKPYVDAQAAAGMMPPTMLCTDYIPLLHEHLDLGWGLMARHSLAIHKSVAIGDTVTVTGEIAEKYEKKGRHYWTLDYSVRNSRGELCLENRITCSVD